MKVSPEPPLVIYHDQGLTPSHLPRPHPRAGTSVPWPQPRELCDSPRGNHPARTRLRTSNRDIRVHRLGEGSPRRACPRPLGREGVPWTACSGTSATTATTASVLYTSCPPERICHGHAVALASVGSLPGRLSGLWAARDDPGGGCDWNDYTVSDNRDASP